MINVLGGIGLFLLGMTMLTNGLKELAGDALKKMVEPVYRRHYKFGAIRYIDDNASAIFYSYYVDYNRLC